MVLVQHAELLHLLLEEALESLSCLFEHLDLVKELLVLMAECAGFDLQNLFFAVFERL